MKYGFVIDQRKCIGCHACTVACKAEHDVPIGVYRTWVKYIEKGEFPNTRRHFLVTRCNHCTDAPCVAICPTKALFKRADGIVDFDRERCIGCKSCMQACPYDALYIDPETHTAAKCNFCAHRVDQGLQPACVVVCPEQAIIAGDLENPASQIAQLVGRESVHVRRPEQGTGPNVYYIGADEHAINPEVEVAPVDLYQFMRPARLTATGTVIPLVDGAARHDGHATKEMQRAVQVSTASFGIPADEAQAMEQKARGTAAARANVRVGYDIPKARPWGWMVSAYLATKSVAAGVFLVTALAIALGATQVPLASDRAGAPPPVVEQATLLAPLFGLFAPLLALAFLGATVVLLVGDLKRPERFWYLLAKPNPTSWLVWGGWILQFYGALLVVWLAANYFHWIGLANALLWPAAAHAVGAAGYTAFLFGQAEGRDFWQSPLLLPHLIVQAVIAGVSVLALAGLALGIPTDTGQFFARVLLLALLAHAALIGCELFVPHANMHVRAAAHVMFAGPLARAFWLLAVGVGLLVAGIAAWLALALVSPVALALAALASLVGLVAYEHGYVVAGQSVPIS